jgi:alpha-glucosidase
VVTAGLWWQQGVVYQIYPRSFQDTDGDGVGDLRGVLRRLDHVTQTLGVEAIWLSPFFTSPMADFGYDVADYCDVDPLFGSLADFDQLLVKAHHRGLKVIVDYVPNHTSDRHPWFQASRSSRDNPYRDWYIWRDGSPPNNWLANFGGSAWEYDPRTRQSYLHSFLKEQPDLNWRNPAVVAAMLDVLRFWLERGVDGFRMDTVHRIMKHPDLLDNPPNPGGKLLHKEVGEYDSQLHIYDKDDPDVHLVLRQFRQVLEDYSTPGNERVAIGEAHIYNPTELVRFYGEQLDELHLPFNFGLLFIQWAAEAVRASVDGYEAALPVGAWPNYVLGNHDEARIATRLGPAGARLAMLLLLTLRGTPTLYQGDELGIQDVPIPPEKAQDPWGKNVPGLNLSRDPARTPMPWDTSAPNAGFCPAGVEPWLPLNPDRGMVNVASELADASSVLSLTRQLLALRRATPALRSGSYRSVDGPPDCYLYLREAEADRCLVMLNFGAAPREVSVPDGQVLVSTHLDRAGAAGAGSVRLRSMEGVVVRLAGPLR